MRPAGAQAVELAPQRLERAVHAAGQVLLQLVEVGLCHDGLPNVPLTFIAV